MMTGTDTETYKDLREAMTSRGNQLKQTSVSKEKD